MKNKKKPVKIVCAVLSGALVLIAIVGIASGNKRKFR